MHCIGELMLPMPTWPGSRYGCSAPWRARRTAFIIRSEPMAMMRLTSCSGTALRAEPALGVGDHRLHDVAAEVRVLRRRGSISSPMSVAQIT